MNITIYYYSKQNFTFIVDVVICWRDFSQFFYFHSFCWFTTIVIYCCWSVSLLHLRHSDYSKYCKCCVCSCVCVCVFVNLLMILPSCSECSQLWTTCIKLLVVHLWFFMLRIKSPHSASETNSVIRRYADQYLHWVNWVQTTECVYILILFNQTFVLLWVIFVMYCSCKCDIIKGFNWTSVISVIAHDGSSFMAFNCNSIFVFIYFWVIAGQNDFHICMLVLMNLTKYQIPVNYH